MDTSLDSLKAYLSQLPAGAVADTQELTSKLSACWGELEGANEGGMEAYKLWSRMETVTWNPPTLEFALERHGAVVLGSTLAELQNWSVNIDSGTATYTPGRKRVVVSKQAKLDVRPIAKEIAQIVVDRKVDARVAWKNAETVQIHIGKIIPDEGPKQTVASRRRRFWAALEGHVRPNGWVRPSKGRAGTLTRA